MDNNNGIENKIDIGCLRKKLFKIYSRNNSKDIMINELNDILIISIKLIYDNFLFNQSCKIKTEK